MRRPGHSSHSWKPSFKHASLVEAGVRLRRIRPGSWRISPFPYFSPEPRLARSFQCTCQAACSPLSCCTYKPPIARRWPASQNLALVGGGHRTACSTTNLLLPSTRTRSRRPSCCPELTKKILLRCVQLCCVYEDDIYYSVIRKILIFMAINRFLCNACKKPPLSLVRPIKF